MHEAAPEIEATEGVASDEDAAFEVMLQARELGRTRRADEAEAVGSRSCSPDETIASETVLPKPTTKKNDQTLRRKDACVCFWRANGCFSDKSGVQGLSA